MHTQCSSWSWKKGSFENQLRVVKQQATAYGYNDIIDWSQVKCICGGFYPFNLSPPPLFLLPFALHSRLIHSDELSVNTINNHFGGFVVIWSLFACVHICLFIATKLIRWWISLWKQILSLVVFGVPINANRIEYVYNIQLYKMKGQKGKEWCMNIEY